MKTPIYDFVQNYIKSDTARFHMPGHKGISRLGCEALDITEIKGADVLYSPDGIIRESEYNATSLFGSAHTFYSTEGSSLAIRAMLAVFCEHRGEARPLILAARNAHKAFIYTCALLDLDVEWLFPNEFSHICAAPITPDALWAKLGQMKKKPSAVYITSPDYLGNVADIVGLAAVCDKFSVPLLVDNAHGAYLGFLQPSLHPIALGASACCDSAHKTLPVLTGGAYLHFSKKAPPKYIENARKYLSLFASTSPSYLILQSLDLFNAQAGEYREKLAGGAKKVKELEEKLEKLGFTVIGNEPMKITVDAKKSGYTGDELAENLRAFGMECEFSDPDYLVLMITPENSERDFERLISAFESIPPRAPIAQQKFLIPAPRAAMSVRRAILSPSQTVPVRQAKGKICAAPAVACPPAVPIVVSGEIIEDGHIRLMEYYGSTDIDIVD